MPDFFRGPARPYDRNGNFTIDISFGLKREAGAAKCDLVAVWAASQMAQYYRGIAPDYTYEIFDARDDGKLPVFFNWDLWLDANSLSDKTFGGVKNKHEARNLRFRLKGEPPFASEQAEGLQGMVSIIW